MLEQLYKLYLDNEIISDAITYDMFSQSNEQQQQGLYDLGLAQGLFDTTDLNTFKTAWSEKKNASQNRDGESELEDGTSVQPASPTTPRIQTGETDTALERTFGKNPVTDFFGDMYRSYKTGVSQGASVDDAFAVFGQGKEVTDEALDDFREAVDIMQRQGPTDELRQYYKDVQKEGGGILGTVKALGKNFGVAPQVLISSLTGLVNPTSIAAGIAGAGTGAAAGAALTSISGPGALFGAGTGALGGAFFGASGMLETATTFTELLQKELDGKPFTNENIRAVLEDDDKISSIKRKSVGRGVTIGAIEALTSGLAGKLGTKIVKSAIPKGISRPASVLASGVVEGAGGALGERAGMAVAGQEVDAAEIGLEAVGGGPITFAKFLNPAYRLAKKAIPGRAKYTKDGQSVTKEFVEDFIDKAEDTDLVNFKVDIENDSSLKQKLQNKKTEAQQNVQIKENFERAYPDISEDDLNTLIPLQRDLDNAKNNPVDTASKEEQLKSDIKKITDRYANPIESPAEVLNEEQSDVSETVVEGDNQPTELTGETTQAQKETPGQPAQESEVETEISETEEVGKEFILQFSKNNAVVVDKNGETIGEFIFSKAEGPEGNAINEMVENLGIDVNQNDILFNELEVELEINQGETINNSIPFGEKIILEAAKKNPSSNIISLNVNSLSVDPYTQDIFESLVNKNLATKVPVTSVAINDGGDFYYKLKTSDEINNILNVDDASLAPRPLVEGEVKGAIRTDGDVIVQTFIKTIKGRERPNSLAPISVLDEFDLNLEDNNIEGLEIIGVRQIKRTKDGKVNTATLAVRDGDGQFEAEVVITPKQPDSPQVEPTSQESQTVIEEESTKKQKEFKEEIKQKVKQSLNEITPAFNTITEKIASAFNIKFARNLKSAITGRGRILEGIRSTPTPYVDQTLGIKNSTVVYDKVFRPVVEGYAKMSFELQDKVEEMDAAYNTLKKKGVSSNQQLKDAYEIGIYLVAREHEGNIKANMASETSPPAAAMLRSTIQLIEDGSILTMRDATALQELLDKYEVDGQITAENVKKGLSKEQLAAANKVIELNNSLYEKAKEASQRRGIPFVTIEDYTHRQVLMSKEASDVDVLDKSSKFAAPSTFGGTIIERIAGPRAIQFNPFESSKRGAQETLIDYELTPSVLEVQDLTRALEKKYKNGNKGQKEGAIALSRAIRELLRVTYLRTYMQADNNLSRSAIKEIKRIAYRQLLSSAPRFSAELIGNATMLVAQPAEVVSNAYGKYAPVWSKVGAKPNDTFINLLKNLNSAESVKLAGRRGQKILDSDGQTKYADEGNFLNLSESPTSMQGPVAQKMEYLASIGPKQTYQAIAKASDFLMGGADRVIARPIWVSKFAFEFKNKVKEFNNEDIDLSVKDFDELSKKNSKSIYLDPKYDKALKQAVREADRTSVELVTSSNPLNGIIKNMARPESRKSLMNYYRTINSFMANFTLNEYATAKFAIGALTKEGKISQGKAGRLLAGVFARMSSYVVLYKLFADFMDQLFGAPEDEQDRYDLFAARQMVGAVSTLMFRQSLGNIPSLPINLGIEYLNKNYLESLRAGADYNSYENSIVLSLINLDQLGKKSLGEIGLPVLLGPITPLYRSANRAFDLAVRSQTRKTEDARNRALEELTNRMTFEALGQVGLVPFYKDARRIQLKKRFDEDKKSKPISKSQLRKINPDLYKRLYGPDSPEGKRKKRERELKRKRNARK